MHRSGTSMITRAINLLGLELGQPLLKPTPDNLGGYWEHSFFVRINSELLHTMRCDPNGFASYRELLKLPSLSKRVSIDDDKFAEIQSTIGETFSNPVWGWKDPRTVLTFPLWQMILPKLRFRDVRPVIIVRHPQQVVQSLVRRVQADATNDMSQDRLAAMAEEIWTAYNEILLMYAREQRCFVGTYESFVDPVSARTQLARLAQYCGLDSDLVPAALTSIVLRQNEPHLLPTGTSPAGILYNQLRDYELEDVGRHAADPSDWTLRSPLQNDASVVAAAEPDEQRLLRRAEQFKENGRIDAAVDLLRKGLGIRPHYRAARFMLGYTLMETGHITESAIHARSLIQHDAEDPVGHGLLAFGLTQQARIREAMMAFHECLRCLPSNHVARSNLLFASLYGDHHEAEEVTQLHMEAGQSIAQTAGPWTAAKDWPSKPAPLTSRRLRIGYLSGDFQKHPVGYFLRSILNHHNGNQVHVTCYDIGSRHDELTAAMRHAAHRWQDLRSMSSGDIVERIRADNLDVMIDLVGHSSGNRATVITQRVAPVQAMYLGYPCTSGLPNMDFVISDSHVSPPKFDHLYGEAVLRLDGCFLCFHPHEDAPDVAPPPCVTNGFVTFGSFNNLPKISPSTVRLWSDVLSAVDDSRLVLKALSFVDEGTRELFYAQFAEHGVQRSRIDLLPPTIPLARFLDEYRRIDVGLDPIPYTGGTTTMEALWMGVPVITLPGSHFFSRMSLSILKTMGLDELVAGSSEDFVRLARTLAANPKRIIELRSTLRILMRNSGLCDGQQFTEKLESALLTTVCPSPPNQVM